ncbi:MAG: type II toxin-antitoxin system VapC family toxin [Paracoccaceae bacterium]
MRVLVDTQALLWWLMDSDRLGSKARRVFMSEDPIISPVVLWEIAIKVRLGKLTANVSEVCAAVTQDGFERLGFSDRHMIALADLDLHHRDPFDRMLIVQSQVEQIPLLSSDEKMNMYGIDLLDSRV